MHNFELYLEKYCRQYGYTVEEAREHALVKEVGKYYNEDVEEQGYGDSFV